jgi:hypothetical protein
LRVLLIGRKEFTLLRLVDFNMLLYARWRSAIPPPLLLYPFWLCSAYGQQGIDNIQVPIQRYSRQLWPVIWVTRAKTV